ncbi:MAG: choice-of-anchor B family protein, partial [Xanthomonadaceae bacterium]|nr:choice-of-anchor B family protein [Xanthomonadaceae bacterium]
MNATDTGLMMDMWSTSSHLRVLIALAAVAPLAAWAHGDDDVRFVAANGTDSFGCETPATACRTVGYAAGQAGKGGVVRVAAGSYPVDTQADLFFLSDASADITGGYSPDFSERAPTRYPTLLIGVPHALRDALEARGFHVIVDTKWDGTGLGADPLLLAKAIAPMQASASSAACVAGDAGGFPCDRVDLLSHIALGDFSSAPARANDVWGFVDLNTDREYALVGLENGVAVVDISDPSAPVEVGTIAGEGTGWRDVKVVQRHNPDADRWQAYAYVTADAVHDRLTVIDLTGLPNRIALAARATDDLSAHNLNIAGVDPALAIPLPGRAPVLYLAGSNRDGGAFRAFSLSNPVVPALIAGGSGYMHDATAALLTDPAQVAGCAAPAAGACEVLADFNEDTFTLWDVTTPAAPALLSVRSFATATYVHSGSWSESGRYLFVHDELDERDAGLNTTVYVFDVANLAAPIAAGSWTGPTGAIDHNGYPRGNRYYISNYSRGLTVLDITDPAAPVETGRFDTFTVSDATGFVGAWGVYP